jgi:hypothetical protein
MDIISPSSQILDSLIGTVFERMIDYEKKGLYVDAERCRVEL